ncbi:exosome non-catalytic core subunit rrp46 [Coniosporium apollinis]|uniref:Exosome non-catalytic core subunit rrp46 n=1 Tax=Coniosporium apollinis TaxID=61459 RepID=A0ABQ9NI13_9PEZI|nr:exosome non-catalytic core subunit rrp46 [Coniosporium apollinis]
MPARKTILNPLRRPDGSATHSQNGYTVIGAVNGPIEVQRRDEIPDEAAIEVNVRPATGVGSPKERHIEHILTALLRHIILTHDYPRTLIQLTLQILSVPATHSTLPSSSSLPILPALINTAYATLLAGSIRLSTTLTAVLVAVPKRSGKGEEKIMVVDPDPEEGGSELEAVAQKGSLHVFAFDGRGEAVLVHSEGKFEIEEWEQACEAARGVCIGISEDGADAMEVEGEKENMVEGLRELVKGEVEKESRWRGEG